MFWSGIRYLPAIGNNVCVGDRVRMIRMWTLSEDLRKSAWKSGKNFLTLGILMVQ